ncbi:MAG: ribonuclease HI family protein [Desulfobulbaceae bacterium]|nr:ribonuclease HI family protein [Desulfobulbaceae bacterium]
MLAPTVKTTKLDTEAGKPDTSQNSEQTQPPLGWCRLFTDGASRGNPGHAGAGAVLYDVDGKEQRWSSYLGTCTNNVAEYRALLLGLKEAGKRGCTHLALFLDAELVVRQLQGHYKVKHEHLQPLYREACHLLKGFADWSVAHVPRTYNAVADKLANEGIDQALAGAPTGNGTEKIQTSDA